MPDVDAPPVDACAVTTDLTPAELLGEIDVFVVLCMENRSFDHYFGALTFLEGRDDIDGLQGNETNPDGDGNPVEVHLLENFTPADPPHSWDSCHAQWNGGANDGFVKEHAGSDEADVMGYYTRGQLPMLYALADAGAVCDAWFSPLLGPTWPNRYYLHGGSSNGIKSNLPAAGFTSIFSRLDDAGISHKNYYHDIAWASGGYFKFQDMARIEQFFEDAEAGNLPQFSLIDPQFLGGGANDDHPSHDIRNGQALIAAVTSALAQSPQWNKCLLAITYDEHGGFYDHVAPPTTVDDEGPEFQQLGIRVPSVVVGPYVKRGCAVSTVLEHTSVASTLTRRYDLEPLNARVEASNDLSSCIDPRYLGDPQSPPPLPEMKISRSAWRSRPVVPVHEEMIAALDRGGIPRELDRRHELDKITENVLGWAERLGAITLTD